MQIQQISGTLNRGGWQCTLKSLSDSDELSIYQNIAVILQGAFGTSFGSPRTAFNGFVQPTRTAFDVRQSVTDYVARTTDGILERGWLQGLGLADTDAVAREHYHQWDSVTGGGAAERMTLGRIVRHILGFRDALGAPPATNPDWVAHTNAVYHATENPHGWISLDGVETEPFDAGANPDGTMRVDQFIVRESTNLWNTLRGIARTEFFEIWFDKFDHLHYSRHPMYLTVLPNPVMTFDSSFAAAPPIVEYRDDSRIRQVRLDAFQDDGSILHSEYPAAPVHVYGDVTRLSNIRCNDQDTLDSWAERLYNFSNRPYTVKWTASGVCGLLFDILDRVQITYTGTDINGVHFDWAAEKFWIHDITVTPDANFSGQTVFTLEAENL